MQLRTDAKSVHLLPEWQYTKHCTWRGVRANYYFQFGPQWHLDSYDSIQCDQSEGRIQINRCGQSESLWNWIWMWMFSDVGCCYLCFVFCSVYSYGHCKNMVRLFNRLCAYIQIKINSIFKHQVATVVNIKFMPRRVPRVWMPKTLVAPCVQAWGEPVCHFWIVQPFIQVSALCFSIIEVYVFRLCTV